MKSETQSRYCQAHKDQLCVAIDMNLQVDSQERHLCVECLKNPFKSRNSLSYGQTHNFLCQKKKLFKSEQESQNQLNLGILKELSQMAEELRVKYNKIFDQLQNNLNEQMSVIQSVQINLDEYLECINLDQYFNQETFTEKFQYKSFEKNVKNTLDQLLQKESCHPFLEMLRTIDTESIKFKTDPQDKKQKRSKLSFQCDEHDEEIRMYDQNESTPEDQRLICDECAIERDGPFTPLTNIFKKWEEQKNNQIDIIEKEKQSFKVQTEHFQDKLQVFNDKFSKKICDIMNITTQYKETRFENYQIKSNALNKEWKSLSKDELLRIAESIINSKNELQESNESINSKQKGEIIQQIKENLLGLQDILMQYLLEMKIVIKSEEEKPNFNDQKIVKLTTYNNVFILEHKGIQIEKIVKWGIIMIDSFRPKKIKIENSIQTQKNPFIQSQLQTIFFRKQKKEKQSSHVTTQFQKLLRTCKSQVNLGYFKCKAQQRNKSQLILQSCVFQKAYPYKINYQIIEQNSIQQNDHCYVVGIYNEQKLVLAGAQKQIKVFDFKFGQMKELEVLQGHTADVVSFFFMKKAIQFLSAGWDETVRIWKLNQHHNWICEHTLQHKGWITQVLMNKAEDQIISCGDPKNIYFWIKNKTEWECSQILIVHTLVVWSISLNESQNKLISCGEDSQIVVSSPGKDKKWAAVQTINCDCGYRIGFITDDLFTFQPNYGPKMIIYQFDAQSKQFNKIKEAKINQDGVCTEAFFPISFKKSRQILINKNGKRINIMKRKNNDNFIVEQSIKFGNYSVYGDMTDDGEYLITWDYASKQFQVRQQQ